MSPVVVLDACVLYLAALRDLLIRLAAAGAFRALWSERILDEVFASLVRNRPGLEPARLARTRALMTRALPEAMVDRAESDLPPGGLPDVNDVHVVATALQGMASAIVTFNLRDFPDAVLVLLGLRGIHPDEFVVDCHVRVPNLVRRVLRDQADQLTRPIVTVDELLEMLAQTGLVKFAAACRSGEGSSG